MPNNNEKKYASLSTLQTFLSNLRNTFSALSHKHSISDLTDYKVDTTLSSASSNPIANKTVDAEFDAVSQAMGALESAIDGKADSGHTHDDRYYTETEIDQKLSAKSDSTHNHDSKYDALGAAAEALTSAKSYADSAASSAANTVKNDLLNGAGGAYDTLKELGDLINENTDAIDALETVATNKADKTHTHAISDVTDLQTTIDTMNEDIQTAITNGIPVVNATVSQDGATLTATCDSITSLYNGLAIIIIPSNSTYGKAPTLDINGLGANTIRRKTSASGSYMADGQLYYFLYRERPSLLIYDGYYWNVADQTKPAASDLYGVVTTENGGTGKSTIGENNFLVGHASGGNIMREKTPEEVVELIGAVKESDHNWVQIYDSGETTEQINSFANINISGYKKIMMAIKCVNDTTNASTTRYGSAIFKATNGTTYQFPVFNSMFFGSETTTASIGFFEFIDGWIVCPQVVRSIKYSDFLTSTEGGTCTNMNNMGSGLMKCTNPLSTVTISNLDQNADFFFGVGSRVIVWGSVI